MSAREASYMNDVELSCPKCDRTFTRSNNLNRHLITQHDLQLDRNGVVIKASPEEKAKVIVQRNKDNYRLGLKVSDTLGHRPRGRPPRTQSSGENLSRQYEINMSYSPYPLAGRRSRSPSSTGRSSQIGRSSRSSGNLKKRKVVESPVSDTGDRYAGRNMVRTPLDHTEREGHKYSHASYDSNYPPYKHLPPPPSRYLPYPDDNWEENTRWSHSHNMSDGRSQQTYERYDDDHYQGRYGYERFRQDIPAAQGKPDDDRYGALDLSQGPKHIIPSIFTSLEPGEIMRSCSRFDDTQKEIKDESMSELDFESGENYLDKNLQNYLREIPFPTEIESHEICRLKSADSSSTGSDKVSNRTTNLEFDNPMEEPLRGRPPKRQNTKPVLSRSKETEKNKDLIQRLPPVASAKSCKAAGKSEKNKSISSAGIVSPRSSQYSSSSPKSGDRSPSKDRHNRRKEQQVIPKNVFSSISTSRPIEVLTIPTRMAKSREETHQKNTEKNEQAKHNCEPAPNRTIPSLMSLDISKLTQPKGFNSSRDANKSLLSPQRRELPKPPESDCVPELLEESNSTLSRKSTVDSGIGKEATKNKSTHLITVSSSVKSNSKSLFTLTYSASAPISTPVPLPTKPTGPSGVPESSVKKKFVPTKITPPSIPGQVSEAAKVLREEAQVEREKSARELKTTLIGKVGRESQPTEPKFPSPIKTLQGPQYMLHCDTLHSSSDSRQGNSVRETSASPAGIPIYTNPDEYLVIDDSSEIIKDNQKSKGKVVSNEGTRTIVSSLTVTSADIALRSLTAVLATSVEMVSTITSSPIVVAVKDLLPLPETVTSSSGHGVRADPLSHLISSNERLLPPTETHVRVTGPEDLAVVSPSTISPHTNSLTPSTISVEPSEPTTEPDVRSERLGDSAFSSLSISIPLVNTLPLTTISVSRSGMTADDAGGTQSCIIIKSSLSAKSPLTNSNKSDAKNSLTVTSLAGDTVSAGVVISAEILDQDVSDIQTSEHILSPTNQGEMSTNVPSSKSSYDLSVRITSSNTLKKGFRPQKHDTLKITTEIDEPAAVIPVSLAIESDDKEDNLPSKISLLGQQNEIEVTNKNILAQDLYLSTTDDDQETSPTKSEHSRSTKRVTEIRIADELKEFSSILSSEGFHRTFPRRNKSRDKATNIAFKNPVSTPEVRVKLPLISTTCSMSGSNENVVSLSVKCSTAASSHRVHYMGSRQASSAAEETTVDSTEASLINNNETVDQNLLLTSPTNEGENPERTKNISSSINEIHRDVIFLSADVRENKETRPSDLSVGTVHQLEIVPKLQLPSSFSIHTLPHTATGTWYRRKKINVTTSGNSQPSTSTLTFASSSISTQAIDSRVAQLSIPNLEQNIVLQDNHSSPKVVNTIANIPSSSKLKDVPYFLTDHFGEALRSGVTSQVEDPEGKEDYKTLDVYDNVETQNVGFPENNSNPSTEFMIKIPKPAPWRGDGKVALEIEKLIEQGEQIIEELFSLPRLFDLNSNLGKFHESCPELGVIELSARLRHIVESIRSALTYIIGHSKNKIPQQQGRDVESSPSSVSIDSHECRAKLYLPDSVVQDLMKGNSSVYPSTLNKFQSSSQSTSIEDKRLAALWKRESDRTVSVIEKNGPPFLARSFTAMFNSDTSEEVTAIRLAAMSTTIAVYRRVTAEVILKTSHGCVDNQVSHVIDPELLWRFRSSDPALPR